jgi:4-diphosphocytidyl-2-C-methyl-D-erythritol kinase
VDPEPDGDGPGAVKGSASRQGWPAPAKLNLFLHVLGRRADGYHSLQTLFQFVDLSDWIGLEPRRDSRIRRIGGLPSVPAERDLTVRAARTLQAQAPEPPGVDIIIDKHIPEGGGLGGGSSDAATVLVALNSLWGLGLGTDRLAALGLELGADVPVFVRGVAAWAEGVGEFLTPIEPPEPWYAIVLPATRVPTGGIFADPTLTRSTRPITIADFLSGAAGNDCEPVVRRRYPEVAAALDWLGQFGKARLTGTGACVFASFPDRQRAAEVARQVPAPWQAYVARGRNRSPLLDRQRRGP